MGDSFSISTDSFQGPLEALLNLIEDRKMAISDISLAQVTDSYLAYVEKLPQLPLGETSQFILVASTLLLIKSRTLLPMLQLSDEERESVEELERRLARYAIFRKGAKLLRKEWGTHPLLFAHRAPAREAVFSPAESSIDLIAKAGARLAALLPKPEAMAKAAVAPVIALEDVISNLKTRLNSAFKSSFKDLTRRTKDKGEIVVYFLAVLELVRSGSASVSQEKLFEDIPIDAEAIGAPRFGYW